MKKIYGLLSMIFVAILNISFPVYAIGPSSYDWRVRPEYYEETEKTAFVNFVFNIGANTFGEAFTFDPIDQKPYSSDGMPLYVGDTAPLLKSRQLTINNSDGSSTSQSYVFYYEGDKLIRLEGNYGNDGINRICDFNYENDRLTDKIYTFSEDGSVENHYKYNYSEDGKVVSVDFADSFGKYNFSFSYDQKGRVSEVKDTTPGGSRFSFQGYTPNYTPDDYYDESGRLIYYDQYSKKRSLKYDNKGRIEEDDDYIYEYDKYDNVIKKTDKLLYYTNSRGEDVHLVEKNSFVYENGKIREAHVGEQVTHYFDENERVIKTVFTFDSGSSWVYEYSYY